MFTGSQVNDIPILLLNQRVPCQSCKILHKTSMFNRVVTKTLKPPQRRLFRLQIIHTNLQNINETDYNLCTNPITLQITFNRTEM